MNSNCTLATTFPTNPDITGIGVRASLYASTLLGIIMTWRERAKPNTDWTSYRDWARTALVTSSALVIAGIYSVRSPALGLTLVDAQIITMLNLFISVSTYTAATTSGYKEVTTNLGLTFRMATLLHGILSATFGLVVYSNPSSFGGVANAVECPNSGFIFVVFGQSISATNPGLRIFAMLFFIWSAFEIIRENRGALALFILRLFFAPKEAFQSSKRWEPSKVGPKRRIAINLLTIGLMIYLLVTTEQIIARNELSTVANVWTFGQILPLVMLLDQLSKAVLRWTKLGKATVD